MSRGGNDDYDEDFPNQGAFWWANAQRALKGRRGKQALAELREALLMLPEKRLVSGAISTVALKEKAAAMPDEVWAWGGDGMFPNYEKVEAQRKVDEQGMGVCAVGAYMLRKRVLELGESPEQAMANLPSASDAEGCALQDTMEYGQEAGLSSYVAWQLADRNDETYLRLTPEERYVAFLDWIDKQLGEGVPS